MTFSIVARSVSGDTWGVAVASKVLAVGRAVPGAEAGVGAVATQAFCNLSFRPRSLDMMREELPPAEVATALIADDPDGSRRQFGIVDRHGASISFTGSDCIPWAGGRFGPGYAVQGNILAGPGVVEAMEAAWRESGSEALEWRLLAALMAGDRAGGDRRGRQSAAMLVVSRDGAHEAGRGGGGGGPSDEAVNLRVDDHLDPVLELSRLLNLRDLCMGDSSSGPPIALDDDLIAEMAALLRRVGFAPARQNEADVMAALERWAFEEYLSARMVPGAIDPAVIGFLRQRAGASWNVPSVAKSASPTH